MIVTMTLSDVLNNVATALIAAPIGVDGGHDGIPRGVVMGDSWNRYFLRILEMRQHITEADGGAESLVGQRRQLREVTAHEVRTAGWELALVLASLGDQC